MDRPTPSTSSLPSLYMQGGSISVTLYSYAGDFAGPMVVDEEVRAVRTQRFSGRMKNMQYIGIFQAM